MTSEMYCLGELGDAYRLSRARTSDIVTEPPDLAFKLVFLTSIEKFQHLSTIST